MSKYLFSFAVLTFALAMVFTIKRLDTTIFFDKPPLQKKLIFSEEVGITNNNFKLKDLNSTASKNRVIADEYYLSWDLVDPEFTKIRVFILTYENLDKFEYSCLSQVLDEHNITTKNLQLINNNHHVKITLKDKVKADNLVSILDSYDINGEFEEIFQFKENLYNEE